MPNMGRVILKLESAVATIPWHTEKEREDFLAHLADSMGAGVRQKHLTWSHNRKASRGTPRDA